MGEQREGEVEDGIWDRGVVDPVGVRPPPPVRRKRYNNGGYQVTVEEEDD